MDAKLPSSDMRYFAQNVVSRTWQVCLPASFAKSLKLAGGYTAEWVYAEWRNQRQTRLNFPGRRAA